MSSPRTPADPLRLELQALPSSVAAGRHAVAAFCARARVMVDEGAVALAVSEALTNAVVHAHPDGATGLVCISACLEAAELVVTVSDDGEGMNPRTDSPGMGMGLALIARLASSLEIDGDGPGTWLMMRFAPAA